MMVRISAAAALALCLAVPVFADDKKNEADLKAMVGNWKVEKAELGGKDLTEFLKVLKFEIQDGGKYIAEHGKEKDEGSFTVDASKNPKEMDIKSTGGPNKGKNIKAIYKQDGDTITICYELGSDKGARPEKFESKADTMLLLVTYKREKK
jgi:uncharacterized protein (TIGR03067 family)